MTGTNTSNNVYITTEETSWIPAKLISSTDTEATVTISASGETKVVKLKDYSSKTLPLQNIDEDGKLKEVEDMVDLPYLHEAAILYNLKQRHKNGIPYTRTGDIVIAVNPYQWINGLYSPDKRDAYANELVWSGDKKDSKLTIEPHVYETSSLAYKGLACDAQNQSILVSGESGAGKTETVKILMSHLASIQTGGAENASNDGGTNVVIKRVLDSNPLLEAFGNAKTVRNDNSSRFGKFTLLQFHCEDPVLASYKGKSIPFCNLAGSRCSTYLLEKSRVVSHVPEERSYHIFYQLLAAPKIVRKNFWEGLGSKSFSSFNYVGETDTKSIEGKTDGEHWERTVDALATIGVEGDQLHTLVRALIAVLQLGNLVFDPDPNNPDDGSIISSSDELEVLAELMGVPATDINKAMTERTVRARNEVYKVPLNVTTANDSRDAFAKDIYACIFDWLVRTINDATCAEKNYADAEQVLEEEEDGGAGFKMIGLLDIFGFESFKVNRFEQLCINFANEKLQQKFTVDIFSSVQEEYEYEGIELGEVAFEDNADVVNLIEGRMGLISVLNEECVRPKGNDTSFVAKVRTLNKDSDCLHFDKFHRAYEFEVKHYAGNVKYDANLFVQKNMDTMPADLLECACKSTNKMIKIELKRSQESRSASSKTGRRRGSLVSQTVSSKFRSQLTSLMNTIGQTRTRYIRCIKPNQQKKPRKMQLPSTAEQLRCAGVVAAVTMSRSAFPNRLEHQFMLERFSPTSKKAVTDFQKGQEHDEAALLEFCRGQVDQLMQKLLAKYENGSDKVPYALGKTRIYFRAGTLEYLEAQRMGAFSDHAILLQKCIRGFIAFRAFVKLRKACVRIQSQLRAHIATKQYRRFRASSIIIQCFVRCAQSGKKLISLRRTYNCTLIQTHWRMAMAISKRKTCILAVVKMQALLRGARQRPMYRAELQEAKEAQKLENQVKALQKKLEEAEAKRIEAEKRAADAPASEVKVIYKEVPAPENFSKEVPKVVNQQSNDSATADIAKAVATEAASAAAAAAAAASSAALTAQQQTLIDESGKMLEYLRKEVFKLRSQNTQLRSDFDALKENNQRLMDANASAGASFQALNQHAKMLAKANEKLQTDMNNLKKQNTKHNLLEMELKEELKMKQATYIAEVHSRLQYQKTMGRIVEEVQERSRDEQLIDDVLMMNDECESDYMAGPTGMQPTPTKNRNSSSRGLGGIISDAISPMSEPRMIHTPKAQTPKPETLTNRFKSFLFGGTPQNQEESGESDSDETDSDSEDETDSEEEYERRRDRMTQVRKPGLSNLQAFSGGFEES